MVSRARFVHLAETALVAAPGPDDLATSVIVVNYRTKELTLDAVRSALREPDVGDVVVVDNASGDGSAAFLREELPGRTVHVVEAPTNLGFGRAVNLAVPGVRSGLLLLLNSDATLLPGAVATLGAALLGSESVALVAPAVYEGDGLTLQPGAYGRFPRPLGPRIRRCRDDRSPRSPDWVSGVAMMLRKEDFLSVGGFDPDFEMYLEDVDLCRRLRRSGRAVLREPDAGVIHLGGQSWTCSVSRREHYQRSKITYFRKSGVAPAAMAYLQVLRAGRLAGARIAARRRGEPGGQATGR